jgi:hypothetical protein
MAKSTNAAGEFHHGIVGFSKNIIYFQMDMSGNRNGTAHAMVPANGGGATPTLGGSMKVLSKIAPAVAGFVLAAATASMAAADPASRADQLLAQAKQATGGAAWNEIKSLSEHGTVKATGLEGSYDSLTDLCRVRATGHFALGPATGAQGWDGKTAWSADPSGQVRIEEGGEASAAAIQQAYRSAYAFFWPARWPATRVYVGERQADGASYDAVKVTPKGAEPFEVWIDRRTHRIGREVQLGGVQPHTQIMADYRKVQGVLLPFLNTDTMGEPKFDTVTAAAALTAGGALAATSFAPPPPPVEPDPFPAGQDRVSIPFKLANNHIYVEAAIDGQAPQRFLFDTGATASLDYAHAAMLGIKSEGTLPGAGFGEGTATMGMAHVRSVELGAFKLANQVFFTEDDTLFDRVEGFSFAGLLGYEIPKRAVMVIDYAKGEITLVRPTAFRPPSGAVGVPFKFDEHIPMIEASVDGIPGEFQIDTGSRSSLTLMGPFAEANHLAERYHATRVATAGYGMGGPARELLARAETLQIGSLAIKRPVTLIAGGARGAGAMTRTAGNIGGDLLRRFTLTLDYGHRMLYLQPNAAFDMPDLFDRSGLWVMRQADGGIEIVDVTAGSTGATAGLANGDRILAVDGVPATRIELSDLRDRFKGAPGTRFTLSVARGGAPPRDVSLTLGDLI